MRSFHITSKDSMPASHDILCFSHLPWDFSFQRPQQLLTRAAQNQRVFYIEDAIQTDAEPTLSIRCEKDKLFIVTPKVRARPDSMVATEMQRMLLDKLVSDYRIDYFVAWYFSPTALKFSRHLRPRVAIYDCFDQHRNAANLPSEMTLLERELLAKADIVTTSSIGLYETKKHLHDLVLPLPNSIDSDHFKSARYCLAEPRDQFNIPYPRIGYPDFDSLKNLNS